MARLSPAHDSTPGRDSDLAETLQPTGLADDLHSRIDERRARAGGAYRLFRRQREALAEPAFGASRRIFPPHPIPLASERPLLAGSEAKCCRTSEVEPRIKCNTVQLG